MRVNERALLVVVAALEKYAGERPYDNSWPDDEKAEISFSHWALDEILNLIWDHPWTSAADVVEEFAFKLQIAETYSVMTIQKQIFSIAAKTALEILEDIKEAEK